MITGQLELRTRQCGNNRFFGIRALLALFTHTRDHIGIGRRVVEVGIFDVKGQLSLRTLGNGKCLPQHPVLVRILFAIEPVLLDTELFAGVEHGRNAFDLDPLNMARLGDNKGWMGEFLAHIAYLCLLLELDGFPVVQGGAQRVVIGFVLSGKGIHKAVFLARPDALKRPS